MSVANTSFWGKEIIPGQASDLREITLSPATGFSTMQVETSIVSSFQKDKA